MLKKKPLKKGADAKVQDEGNEEYYTVTVDLGEVKGDNDDDEDHVTTLEVEGIEKVDVKKENMEESSERDDKAECLKRKKKAKHT